MAGTWRNAMVKLGFTEDAYEYDAYAEELDELAQPHDRFAREDASVTPLRRVPDRADVVHQLPVGGLSRISTVHPNTYNDAQQIGADFRDNIPVIMDLTDLSEGDAKRLVDFAAGLVFGLEGSISRVTRNVFLLSPAHVDVGGYDAAGEVGRDLFNQS